MHWLPVLAMTVSALGTTVNLSPSLDRPAPPGTGETLQVATHPQQSHGYGARARDMEFIPLPVSLLAERTTTEAIAYTDIWDRMRSGFALPAPAGTTPAVQAHLDRFSRHPVHLRQMLQRGEPYLFHILNRLEQRGLPAELALLPVVESAFEPSATSPAGAAGLWQFMPDTATYIGLKQDWWHDERRDLIASTEAALDYLTRLHRRFDGDWLLAMAAYNAGSARVQKAIRRNRNDGKPVDFWHLPLPDETRAYVPKLIALRTVINNPADYRVTLPSLPNMRYFSSVDTGGQIDLMVAAQLADISVDELQRLNSGIRRMITPPDTFHVLLIPRGSERVFLRRLALLPEDQRVQSIRHRVRRGDTLSTIAQHYRTTVSMLRKANQLESTRIIAGELLVVPGV